MSSCPTSSGGAPLRPPTRSAGVPAQRQVTWQQGALPFRAQVRSVARMAREELPAAVVLSPAGPFRLAAQRALQGLRVPAGHQASEAAQPALQGLRVPAGHQASEALRQSAVCQPSVERRNRAAVRALAVPRLLGPRQRSAVRAQPEAPRVHPCVATERSNRVRAVMRACSTACSTATARVAQPGARKSQRAAIQAESLSHAPPCVAMAMSMRSKAATMGTKPTETGVRHSARWSRVSSARLNP